MHLSNPNLIQKMVRPALGGKPFSMRSSELALASAGPGIPTPQEIQRILAAATGRRRPFLVTTVFTGLRSSELRGLRWPDIDFEKARYRSGSARITIIPSVL